MANILQIWKQQKAEAEALGSKGLKLQSIDGLFTSQKFEKFKGSNIVKYVQKKYFSYIIDKIVSLRRSFYKALVILSWFSLLLFYFYYQYISTLHSLLKFFKVSFFTSLSYKYMKIWYFHGQYKVSGLGTNKICYIFDLCHMSKVAAHFQKKNKMFIYLFKYPNEETQESRKY